MEIVNKVASSGLVTLNLEDYLPKEESAVFDLKGYLFMELILKEKDYREALKNTDWAPYQNRSVALLCSADAVIPVWAYMLAAAYLQPVAAYVYMGTPEEAKKHLMLKAIEAIDATAYTDQRIVVKGCGEVPVDSYAYTAITNVLLPHVKSVMYGEPCSTVPVYKKR